MRNKCQVSNSRQSHLFLKNVATVRKEVCPEAEFGASLGCQKCFLELSATLQKTKFDWFSPLMENVLLLFCSEIALAKLLLCCDTLQHIRYHVICR